MIRRCTEEDFETIYSIVNDAATAYKGVIPADRWREPYMPKEELRHEIEAGVLFWGYEEGGELTGVMALIGQLNYIIAMAMLESLAPPTLALPNGRQPFTSQRPSKP